MSKYRPAQGLTSAAMFDRRGDRWVTRREQQRDYPLAHSEYPDPTRVDPPKYLSDRLAATRLLLAQQAIYGTFLNTLRKDLTYYRRFPGGIELSICRAIVAALSKPLPGDIHPPLKERRIDPDIDAYTRATKVREKHPPRPTVSPGRILEPDIRLKLTNTARKFNQMLGGDGKISVSLAMKDPEPEPVSITNARLYGPPPSLSEAMKVLRVLLVVLEGIRRGAKEKEWRKRHAS